MKLHSTLSRLFVAVLLLSPLLSSVSCTRDSAMNSTTERRRIPLAPVGVSSPGIGAPGAGSMDTRATGTVATGQGDTPIEDASNGAVPASGAGTIPGARKGGRL